MNSPLFRTPRPLSLLLGAALLGGCQLDGGKSPGNSHKAPNEDFMGDATVRVLSPANGDALEGDVVLRYEAGELVYALQVEIDDVPYSTSFLRAEGGEGEVVLNLRTGRRFLRLIGLDADGNQLSEHSIAIRKLEDSSPWVTVSSPADGARVPNPVSFTATASNGVDAVTFLADGWELGTVEPGRVLRYEFSGTGTPRHIEAVASAGGVEVARDELTITVLEGSDAPLTGVNELINDALESYPTDGSYGYWWPDDVDWGGNPHDIYYMGRMFSPGDPENRSFCVGMTFEVFMTVEDQLNDLYGGDGSINGIPFDELYTLRDEWFVRELYGRGIVDAMEIYGIGDAITNLDDVRPGDILQFWRHSGSGHNVIFVDWLMDGPDIIGFTYWSTQGSTGGVGYNDEFFGSRGSAVDPNFFFAGRLRLPEDWAPWR